MKRLLFILLLASTLPAISQEEIDNYLLARSSMIKHDYETAISHINTYLTEKPGNTHAIYERGIIYLEMGNFKEATKDFLFVSKRSRGKANLMLAKTEARQGNSENACNYLREHLSTSGKISEKEILLDKDFEKIENTPEWKALWKEKNWYSNYDLLLRDAKYELSNDNYLEAINILNDLEKKAYRKSLVTELISDAYTATGNKKEALKALETSVRSDNRNTSALGKKIDLLYNLGEYEQAEKDCKKMLSQFPDNFKYYISTAKVKSKLGKYNEACELIEKYSLYFPNDHHAIFEGAKIHYENKKYLTSISQINKALKLEAGNANYYYYRGLCYSETNTSKYAIRDFSMALDLAPYNPDYWFAKGISENKNGEIKAACHSFKKAYSYGALDALEFINQNCK